VGKSATEGTMVGFDYLPAGEREIGKQEMSNALKSTFFVDPRVEHGDTPASKLAPSKVGRNAGA